MGGEQ